MILILLAAVALVVLKYRKAKRRWDAADYCRCSEECGDSSRTAYVSKPVQFIEEHSDTTEPLL